jgi:hypothetical protein
MKESIFMTREKINEILKNLSRKSEMQEPDSPASALAFKVFWLRNSEKYRFTNRETNPGVVYALENSRISHVTEIRIEPSLITDEKLQGFTFDIRSSVAELIFEVNSKLRDAESELFNKNFCLQGKIYLFYRKRDEPGGYLLERVIFRVKFDNVVKFFWNRVQSQLFERESQRHRNLLS